MITDINGYKVALLGDPHLGKAFLHGTPLHRRGEREEMQRLDFEKSLNDVQGCIAHVMMGDLFDKWTVPYTIIYEAAQAYLKAAAENPLVTYVILQGNHDASRDLERVSAFKLFAGLVRRVRNIIVVDEKVGRLQVEDTLRLTFVPWHPVHNAADMVEQGKDLILGSHAVFGHWDVLAAFATDNMLPAAQLKELGVQRAITGHDHNKRDMEIDGLPITITGSMQPYSFAEDTTGEFYITLTKLQLETIQIDLRNKCVRVLLAEGEFIDKPIDCLQFKAQKIGELEFDDDTALNVEFEGFDIEKLFEETMEELKVDAAFRNIASERYDAERAKQ